MIEKATMDEQVLFDLLAGYEMHPAPTITNRFGIHMEWVLPIGDDHTVHITMTDEDMRALRERICNRGVEFTPTETEEIAV